MFNMSASLVCWIVIITVIKTPNTGSSSSFSKEQTKRINEWKSHSVYQLLTDRFASNNETINSEDCSDLSKYCGGTFKGIISNLDYIWEMGFDTIWISPIIKNTNNYTMDGYHGYWAQDLYYINPHFGTEDDLKALSAALHNRNMYLMIDVVANHMGYTVNDDYSIFGEFNSSKYYHLCIADLCENRTCNIYNWDYYSFEGQKEIELCKLSGLLDLNQSIDYVNDTLLHWISNYVINTFNTDAIRVDTVAEVNASTFWSYFLESAHVFNVGHVFHNDTQIVGKYQGIFDSLFNYPFYYTLRNVFGKDHNKYAMNESISQMISKLEDDFIDYSVLGVFTDNHENERWLCQFNDIVNYKNAILFSWTFPGIIYSYYGTEHMFNGCNDPMNREVLWTTKYDETAHLYQYIKALSNIRKAYSIYNKSFHVIAQSKYFYAFMRGYHCLVLLTNRGNSNTTFNYLLNANILKEYHFGVNKKYCNAFKNDDCIMFDGDHDLMLQIENGQGKVYVYLDNDILRSEQLTTWEIIGIVISVITVLIAIAAGVFSYYKTQQIKTHVVIRTDYKQPNFQRLNRL